MKKTNVALYSILFTILFCFTSFKSYKIFIVWEFLLFGMLLIMPFFCYKIKKNNNLDLLYKKMRPYSIILYFLIALMVVTIIYYKYYRDCTIFAYTHIFYMANIVCFFVIFSIFFKLLNIKKLPKSSTNISSKKHYKLIFDYVLLFTIASSIYTVYFYRYSVGALLCGDCYCGRGATVQDTFGEYAN